MPASVPVPLFAFKEADKPVEKATAEDDSSKVVSLVENGQEAETDGLGPLKLDKRGLGPRFGWG